METRIVQLKRQFFKLKTLGVMLVALIMAFGAVHLMPSADAFVGYGPKVFDAPTSYGMGVYYAPHHLLIFENPDETADVIEELLWNETTQTMSVYSKEKNQYVSASDTFVAFYPQMDVAMLPAISDNGEGWVEIIYDQKAEKTGWVPTRDLISDELVADWPSHISKFQTWFDFVNLNSRRNGFYWLTGVPEYNRLVRTSPEDKASIIEVTMIRRMKVRHMRGNWMLVELIDFNRNRPIGWIRWRDANGKLLLFPEITGKSRQPIVMPNQ